MKELIRILFVGFLLYLFVLTSSACSKVLDHKYKKINHKQTINTITAKYKVNNKLASKIVASADSAGNKHNIDPKIILSVIAVESMFQPNATNKVTKTAGLMQLDHKVHRNRLKGRNVYDVEHNIDVGTELLAELIDKYNNINVALSRYLGSSKKIDQRYITKINNHYKALVAQ